MITVADPISEFTAFVTTGRRRLILVDVTDQPTGPASRRRFWCLLPLAAGPVVLLACWTFLMLSLSDKPGSCFATWSENPVIGAGKSLAHDFNLFDVPGGFELSIAIYIVVSVIPFLLLWGCLLLAQRSRPDRFLITLSCLGTALMTIYFMAGFAIAYADLARGSWFCSLGFDLVPIGGIILGGGIIILSAIVAWIVEVIGKRRVRHG